MQLVPGCPTVLGLGPRPDHPNVRLLYQTSFDGPALVNVENAPMSWWRNDRGDSFRVQSGGGYAEWVASTGGWSMNLWRHPGFRKAGYRRITATLVSNNRSSRIAALYLAHTIPSTGTNYGLGWVIRFPSAGTSPQLFYTVEAGFAGAATHTFSTVSGMSTGAGVLTRVSAWYDPSNGRVGVAHEDGSWETHHVHSESGTGNPQNYRAGWPGFGGYLGASPYDEPKFADIQIEGEMLPDSLEDGFRLLTRRPTAAGSPSRFFHVP